MYALRNGKHMFRVDKKMKHLGYFEDIELADW